MRSAVLRWRARKCADERQTPVSPPHLILSHLKFDCSNLEPHMWLALSYLSVFFPLWLCGSLRPEGVDKAK